MPETGPLDILARQLLGWGPPSLGGLIQALVPAEGFADFVALVQEYVPEHMGEVLAADSPAAQIAVFANHFQDRYFPLGLGLNYEGPWVDPTLEYTDLLRYIPIPYGGLEWDDLHDMEHWRPGYLLMGSLHVPHRFSHLDEGMAVAWLEQCALEVGEGTMMRLPQGGWSAEDLRRLLDGTEYQVLALFADWLNNDTRNAFLDAHPEYPLMDEWDREVVTILTNAWHQAEAAWNEMAAMSEWLEEDPEAHFNQLLDFIEERREELEEGC